MNALLIVGETPPAIGLYGGFIMLSMHYLTCQIAVILTLQNRMSSPVSV